MFCPNCGKEVKSYTGICETCGTNVAQNPTGPANAAGGAETGLSEYWKAEVPQPEPNKEPSGETSEDPEPVVDSTPYYFTQIRYKTNGEALKNIKDYATKDEAVIAFHNLLYSVMADSQYIAVTCRITDKYGSQAHDTRYWERS